jgi:hypothetical protein
VSRQNRDRQKRDRQNRDRQNRDRQNRDNVGTGKASSFVFHLKLSCLTYVGKRTYFSVKCKIFLGVKSLTPFAGEDIPPAPCRARLSVVRAALRDLSSSA